MKLMYVHRTNYYTLDPAVLSVKLKQNWQYNIHDQKIKLGNFKAKWDEVLAIMTADVQYNKKNYSLTVLFLQQLETSMM